MLLTIIGSTANGNIGSNNDLYKIMNRQPASTLDTNEYQGQPLPLQMDSHDVDSIDQIGNDPIRNLKKKSQANYHRYRHILTHT